jgi:cytoskeletal protein CcmA (bactofilin family)
MEYSKLLLTSHEDNSFIVTGGAIIAKNLTISGTLRVSQSLSTIGNITTKGNVDCSKITSNELIICGPISGTSLSLKDFFSAKSCNILDSLKTGNLNVQDGISCDNLVCNGTITVSSSSLFTKNASFLDSINVTNSITSSNINCNTLFNAKSAIFSDSIKILNDICCLGNCIIKGSLMAHETTFNLCNVEGNLSCVDITSNNVTCGGFLTVDKELKVGNSFLVIGDSKIQGELSCLGKFNVNSLSDSSIVTLGGIDIGSSCKIGGTLIVNDHAIFKSNLVCLDTSESKSTSTGSLVLHGGLGIAGNVFSNGLLSIKSNCYFHSSVNVTGIIVSSSTVDSIDSSTGSLILAGGLGVRKSLFVEKNLRVNGTFIVSGTCDIFESLTVKNNISCKNVASETATLNNICTNSIIVNGDANILTNIFTRYNVTLPGSLFVGKGITIQGDLLCNQLDINNIQCKSITISDVNGLLNIKSSISAGIRISMYSNTRYYNSIDIFGNGTSYVDSIVEALQIANDDNGNWNIITRKTGSNSDSLLTLKSANGSSICIGKNTCIKGNLLLTDTSSSTKTVSIIVENLESSYTLVLPKTGPTKGQECVLACDIDGNLFWKTC